MVKLGVNIDHVATLRQARGTAYPDPVHAAALAELGGADGITIHLREDRRHIQDRDLEILRKIVQIRLNLEMAVTDEMVAIACRIRPDMVTLVPEKRAELTTEGGLDVLGNEPSISPAVVKLKSAGIPVYIFIDPNEKQIAKAVELRVDGVEVHTGSYADAVTEADKRERLNAVRSSLAFAINSGIHASAGHGLNYINVQDIAAIPGVHELNIGHSIVARAVFVGLERAVREMKELMRTAV